MTSPPPIQEPWRTDDLGRLISPAWVLWLQSLTATNQYSASSIPDLDMQSKMGDIIAQSSISDAARVGETELLCWMSF